MTVFIKYWYRINIFSSANVNRATGYASQHIWCLSQARLNCEGYGRKGIQRKNGMGGYGGGLLIDTDGVAPSRTVGVSASVILPYTIKSSRRFLLALAHPGSPGCKMVVSLCDLPTSLCSSAALQHCWL